MRKTYKVALILICLVCTLVTAAMAHPGAVDKWGGHWDKSKGNYHFHSGPLDGQVFKTKALALKALRMELNYDVHTDTNDHEIANTQKNETTPDIEYNDKQMLLNGAERDVVLDYDSPSDFDMRIPEDKVVSGYKVPKAEVSENNVFILERNAIYKANVGRVVDGDTMIVRFYTQSGKLTNTDERVRLIGVDTPETVHPRKSIQFYGPEASFFAKQVLSGADVWIQTDVGIRDRYDRILAYVWIKLPNDADAESEIRTKMFNASLLLGGYAQLLTVQPNSRYAPLFVKFQNEARRAQKGLWQNADILKE